MRYRLLLIPCKETQLNKFVFLDESIATATAIVSIKKKGKHF